MQLLKHASAVLGLGPNDAMNVAEKLYLGGYITYPRTETSLYTASFDFISVLISISKSGSVLGPFATRLLQGGYSLPRGGVDAGDHPPITPTPKVPPRGSLPGHEGRLYDFVLRQFLAALGRDAKFARTKVILDGGGHLFSLTGVVLLDAGFTEVAPWVRLASKTLPAFNQGEVYHLGGAEYKENQTSPPNYLSESELITLMEKHGIGTDASMATHINNICQRNFVEVIARARRLKPTPLGTALVQGYREIDPELVSPELRSNIERNVDLIARGQADLDSVLASVLGIFKQKYEYFRLHVSKLESHFAQVYGTFADSLQRGRPFSLCGRCGSQMILVEDFNKTYCKTCKLTLNLPRDSRYSIEGNDTCPLDGYQLVNYYILREGKETHLRCCPQCYHKSPHPEVSPRLICSQCPEISCPASTINWELGPCPRCSRGKLILNRPIDKAFYATCNHNRCSHSLVLVRNALDVQRSSSRCGHCGLFRLKVVLCNSDIPSHRSRTRCVCFLR